jgi:hypothetical protein
MLDRAIVDGRWVDWWRYNAEWYEEHDARALMLGETTFRDRKTLTRTTRLMWTDMRAPLLWSSHRCRWDLHSEFVSRGLELGESE